MKESKIDYRVNIMVNRAIWEKFIKVAKAKMGLSASSVLMFLMTMFIEGGQESSIMGIVREVVEQMILKEVQQAAKKIEKEKRHGKK